ncbi:hypothetical protein NDU88_005719 [Pleurodeles waltl]|uniref:Uncharacterized protein n=1 Tax=Pleurodeles waltl TaxID=8319 RepID=A0AAV7MFH8_PLEWA|nr:hypothetical protein NDU88_005719 [Pleurodeles waltl]
MFYHLKTYHNMHLGRAQREQSSVEPSTSQAPMVALGEPITRDIQEQLTDKAPKLKKIGSICLEWQKALTVGEEPMQVLRQTAKDYVFTVYEPPVYFYEEVRDNINLTKAM